MIIAKETANTQEPKTIHELFADYVEESFSSEIFEFEPMGNELWYK